MAFEDYKSKPSVVIVYTGEGKGKTSAGLGLVVRALGNRNKVAFIQFIKHWGVSEHVLLRDIQPLFKDQLFFYRGGKGFYNAGDLSEKQISQADHQKAAAETYQTAIDCSQNGRYDVVVCDEVNNAVHDGLITVQQLKTLIQKRSPGTSLCLTGRDFPNELLKFADIVTDMKKIKHHFDEKFLANKGIDF